MAQVRKDGIMVGSEARSVVDDRISIYSREALLWWLFGCSNIPILYHMQIAAFHVSVYPASYPSTHCVV